jgi:hypothetical protein
LFEYLDKVRQKSKGDVYSTVNGTLISNPHRTDFPYFLLQNRVKKTSKFLSFFFNTFKFYSRNVTYFISFLHAFLCYKFWFKKVDNDISRNYFVLDIFVNVDKVCIQNSFNETYLSELYPVLNESKVNYVFLPRLQNVSLNPIKAHKQLKLFFEIINKDCHEFIFEFGLISIADIFRLIWMVLCYPFKTLNLIEKENSNMDVIFNCHLIKDISKVGFDVFSRYILGRNISRMKNITKIYSWSEFQDIERSFNLGIRETGTISVIACQFFVNFPNLFHSFILEVDEIKGCAPHKVLVNGSHYLRAAKNVIYELGVSLRYSDIFKYVPKSRGDSILVLGSYHVEETRNLLRVARVIERYFFKGHPSIDNKKFRRELKRNTVYTDTSIYDLFDCTDTVIGSASGTLAEAVACGITVIIVARVDELIINPLVDVGKGKIWDIVFTREELIDRYHDLKNYRDNNPEEIKSFAAWYKNNFFIEPTKRNIMKVFS